MAPKSDYSRGSLICAVVLLTAYTWYLIGTGNGNAVKYFKDHGLTITEDQLVEGLLDFAFVFGVALATLWMFDRLIQAETKKCPRTLIELAKILMLFASGYGVRLIASISTSQKKGFEPFENVAYLHFMVIILLCTFKRYEQLEREREFSVSQDVESGNYGSVGDSRL